MESPEPRKRYPSDLADEQWDELRDLIPEPKECLQDAKYPRREIVNALLYQARTGCQWRFLPHDLPPWSVVKNYFYAWRDDGTFASIQQRLRKRVRKAAGRKASPSLGIVDSQSIKTAAEASADTTGYDGGKKIKGRKRHILVDVLGLILVVFVTAANVQDRDALPCLMRNGQAEAPRLAKVLVDGIYNGKPVAHAERETGIPVEVVTRTDDAKGFVPLPKRWAVERTFAWLTRDRRLAKDYERTCESSTAWIHISSIRLMLRRMA